MLRTKPATHPLDHRIDREALASSLSDIVLSFQSHLARELPREIEAIGVPASDPDGGRLCIWVTWAEVRVALRSSMPSDEELSEKADEYSFWFGLPPDVDKGQLLAGLQAPALENLAFIRLLVFAINQRLAEIQTPHAAQLAPFTRLIEMEVAAFRNVLAMLPRVSRVGRGGAPVKQKKEGPGVPSSIRLAPCQADTNTSNI